MYFNKKNNFFHGIMFHHFHDEGNHTRGQGSISQDDLYKLIKFIGRSNILDADVFLKKFKENKLKDREVCLTFDDGIKCQIDIALPVLEDFKIKSFFFVYSSLFDGQPDNLEIFRYFRMNYFNSIDEFYINFYKVLNKDLNKFLLNNEKEIKYKKKKFPHYSTEDIKFRLVRDIFLKKNDYENIMLLMIEEKRFKYKQFFSKLFFSEKDLRNLNKLGHLIGLHSHSHPTLMEKLDYLEQEKEYQKCVSIISKIVEKSGDTIKCMSHPCGSYNEDTLQILKKLGIELGFKQIMTIEQEKGMKKINNSFLEIARQDHADIIKRIN
jgi:peptidoglycan/xylan/chitin deacetylase (PgdA/CDA1 family)